MLDQEIRQRLNSLQLTPKDEQILRSRFCQWLNSKERLANVTSLELRIAKVDERLARLTDLFVDGDLDKAQFEARNGS